MGEEWNHEGVGRHIMDMQGGGHIMGGVGISWVGGTGLENLFSFLAAKSQNKNSLYSPLVRLESL